MTVSSMSASRRGTVLIAAVLFVSGACSLVYQLAWLRLLRLIFGASTVSTAVVLAIFMGGLGLGGLWLGRRVERARNPLAYYAALEAGIALTAAVSPGLLAAVRWLYLSLGGTAELGSFGATVVRLVLSAAVLLPPTLLMGGTLPAVAQALQRDRDRGRRWVAACYGVNTLGAVVGALLTTFVLLELCGIRLTVWSASAVNLLLALVVWRLSRRVAEDPEDPEEAVAGFSPPPGETPERGAPAPGLVLPVAGLVGFLFFLMELVWYRMLAPVLGGSSYTFGLILAVALLGIGAGGVLYSFGRERRRPTLQVLGWTCLLEAVALALPYAAGDHLALLAVVLRGYGAVGFPGLVLGWALVTAAVVLPAALVAGYQFPLLVALLGSGRERVASQVGEAYAWNTWGAILGSLAGGFALLPWLSAPRLWRLSVAALALCGLVLALRGRWRPGALAAPLAAALCALGLCAADGPSAFWRHSPIGAGRVSAASFRDANDWRQRRLDARRSVVREVDGVESSVALLEVDDLVLAINGKSDGAAVTDAPTMVMFGLLGGLLHPQPRDVFVLGLGSGTSAGWVGSIDGIRKVEVVELEPAVGELVAAFAPVHRGMSANPKIHLRYGDGREWLRTSSESWDLVLSQPSNPYRAGVADLFSRDFYLSVRQRLRPGGLFVQWLQGYDTDADNLRLVYATLGSVFDHVETWQVHIADLVLVAATEPLVHDFDRLRRQADEEPLASALRWTWRVEGIEGLYSGYVAGDELTRHLAQQAAHRVSSDD
ncbi:MAG: fused MFS/spermidine synthase, partial [Thermoanaerobaculia bacterium]